MKITHRFYLRSAENTEIKAPVYLQITADRKSTKRAIGYDLFAKNWDQTKEQAKDNPAANAKILDLKLKLSDLEYELQKSPKPISIKEIADYVFGREVVVDTILVFFKNRMELENSRKTIGKASYNHYKTCLKYLEEFIKEYYNKNDFYISLIDLLFIKNFDSFLVNKKNLSRNTINTNFHKKFKTTLKSAISQGLIEQNAYDNFKLKKVKTSRGHLTIEQLLKLQHFDLTHNASLDRVRDIFVFSCYTGLRFTDAQDLNVKDIIETDGLKFIQRIQNKTGELVQIPLSEFACMIIDKYRDSNALILGKVLPQISNQKLNMYLKIIADLSGIEMHLTHHMARHTCGTLLVNNGVGLETVQKILGHENIRTTQIYAKSSIKTISNQVLTAFKNINNG